MTKFKIGDKIRRIANGKQHAPIGYETVYDGTGCYIDHYGCHVMIIENQWELVLSKFKVGDKIRRIADPLRDAPIGYEAKVEMITRSGQIWYIDKVGDKVSSLEDNWELITEGPVRTETITRKIPVNGNHGKVYVSSSYMGVEPIDKVDPKAAEQLRAAAKTLMELAECFD